MPPNTPTHFHHATHFPFVKSAPSKHSPAITDGASVARGARHQRAPFNTALTCCLLFLCATAALLAFPLTTEAAIQFGNVTSLGFRCSTSENCNSATQLVSPLTAPVITGSNAVLLIALSVNADGESLPDSITYNGVSLGAPTFDSGRIDFTRTSVWVVTNPVSGANIVADYPDSGVGESGVVMAAYYTGVGRPLPLYPGCCRPHHPAGDALHVALTKSQHFRGYTDDVWWPKREFAPPFSLKRHSRR